MLQLTHLSLLGGIGGFDLGAHWSGIKTIGYCDINSFCRKLMYNRFKYENQYGNIKSMVSPIFANIISGGFPCQDISIANPKAKGIKGKRSGLWNEMFRICRRDRPNYIIIENSSALTFRGLERVLCDLSEIGYDAEWQSISHKIFGLQHKRERVFIIAYPSRKRLQGQFETEIFLEYRQAINGKSQIIFPGWRTRGDIPKPRTFGANNGIPNLMDRNKSLGNAVSPIVAYCLFQCIIKDYEKQNEKQMD